MYKANVARSGSYPADGARSSSSGQYSPFGSLNPEGSSTMVPSGSLPATRVLRGLSLSTTTGSASQEKPASFRTRTASSTRSKWDMP